LASGVSGTEKPEELERTPIRIAQRRNFIETSIVAKAERAPVLAAGAIASSPESHCSECGWQVTIKGSGGVYLC
jgi:hypothetical protein